MLLSPMSTFLQAMILQAVQPVPVPVCFATAWLLIGLAIWSSLRGIQLAADRATQMHKVPCANCQFFTGKSCLKCTVHPTIALTEAAIDCPDYRNSDPYSVVLSSLSNSP
jgi:hypothetical protein